MEYLYPPEKVIVTTKVIERLRRDRYIQQNIKKFFRVISNLMTVGKAYPTETIGEFFVSPRGRVNIRVAWYPAGDFLVIYDFLYEVETGRYIEDWAYKARVGKIRRENYKSKGRLNEMPDLLPLIA